MVLSNKKLKQKLRAEVTESLVAKTDPNSDGTSNPESNSQSHSFRDLLGSASQRPILSKREKRRKIHALGGSDVASNGNSEEKKTVQKKGEPKPSENFPDKKGKHKKRKRDEDEKDGVAASDENGVVMEKMNKNNHNNNKKKKKKKKKNKKKQKKAKTEKEETAELLNEEQTSTGTNENINSQTNEDDSTKVYVGGIPYYSSEEDIRSYFESCGTVTEVDCMKFPETGKFRGIAIISFKTEAAAKRALALDGADMGGLFLKIQPYKANRTTKKSDFAPEIVEGYNRIYIGNLSWDVTEEDLKNLFSDCKISSIRFGMDKETGQFRGYSHVDFTDNLSLTMALQLDQKVLHGRPVRIRCAVPLKGGTTQAKPVPAGTGTEGGTQTKHVPVVDTGAVDIGSGISSGKLRRRTCYECGEKGHLSSDCPKKQTAGPADSNAG